MADPARAGESAGPHRRAQIVAVVGVTAVCLLILVGWGIAGAVLDEPFRVFTKEPLEQYPEAPPYAGILAHVTWLLWAIGGTAAALAAWVLRDERRDDRRSWFFLAASALTALLLADDFLMLHERVFPKIGLPEEVIYAAYAAGFLALVVRFRPELRLGGALIALAAGALWAASLAADFLQEHFELHAHAVEDGAKFIGTALWAAYLVVASARVLSAVVQPRRPGAVGVGQR